MPGLTKNVAGTTASTVATMVAVTWGMPLVAEPGCEIQLLEVGALWITLT
jgi:hypothetical protein